MADAVRVVIDKLNNENYYTWKYKTELLLMKEGLWDVISKPAPTTPTPKWFANDDKARATIGLLLEDNQLGFVRKLTTAAATWEALREYHEKSTLSRKVSLLRSLCRLQLGVDGKMDDHLNKMESLVDQLATLGETIADPLLVAFMLSSLPEDYATLITALETRPEADLTVSLVKNKLLEEYAKRIMKEDYESENRALKSHAQVSSSQAEKSYSKSVTCFFCKKIGHIKADCRKYIKWKNKRGQSHANQVTEQTSALKTEENFCFSCASQDVQDHWCIDSGASTHMCNNKNLFSDFDGSYSESITLANGDAVMCQGKGNCQVLCVNNKSEEHKVKIQDVLYVPELSSNLLSVKKLVEKGNEVHFKDANCRIVYKGIELGFGYLINGLYILKERKLAMITRQSHNECIHDWHVKLGHRNPADILRMGKDNMTQDLVIATCPEKLICEDCIAAKSCRKPFPKMSSSKTFDILELIHTDLCGPMQTRTPGGARYILTVIDDFSRYTTIYLLRCKEQTEEKIRNFIKMSQTQYGKTPKRLRSDRGGEYLGKNFEGMLRSNGVIHEKTVPYSPQQNGIAERKNRTLMEATRAMLKSSNLPNKFWGEAVATANYLQNRVPQKDENKTPYEKWFKEKPAVKHLQAFGTPAYAHIPHEKRRKLDMTAKKLIMVGYEEGTKGYRLLDVTTNKITISRDVTFLPVNPHDRMKNGISSEDHSVDEEKSELVADVEKNEEVNEDPYVLQPRKSSRSNKGIPPVRLVETAYETRASKNYEPTSYDEACSRPDREKWIKSMQEEIDELKAMGTWTLTEAPTDKRIIGCKWVYKLKTDHDGNICRYKSRLVAQGYQQKYGHDYDEVFAPVTKPTTLRLLLTIAGKRNMQVKHYDIKSAYLNGDLTHEVYMKQPPGFEEGTKDTVCKLIKNLYGLKQGANEWNKKLNEKLLAKGFTRSENDPCLYSRKENTGFLYLTVHVDDLIVAGANETILKNFEEEISEEFKIVNLGDLKYYLGIHFERNSQGIFSMDQTTYIMKKLKEFSLEDSKTSKVPIDPGYLKRKEESKPLKSNTKYISAVGSLLYLTVNTRPDIAIAVSILARKVSSPTEADWTEVKRVFKYLKSTRDMKLSLGNPEDKDKQLIGYVDADWGNDPNDRKSNTGYFFTYQGSLLTWQSRKQMLVTLSSTEAEFIALSEAAKEAVWLKRLLKDFNEVSQECVIYEDNQSCIKMLHNGKGSNRTKHIDTRYYFVKDLVAMKEVNVDSLPSDQMTADILTKPLSAVKIMIFARNLGLFTN